MNSHFDIYRSVFDHIPLGLVLVNSFYEIESWNNWMTSKTSLSESEAKGKKLSDLFPGEKYDRYHWALEEVFRFGAPQVLSQILNSYLVPVILDPKDRRGSKKNMMQQHIDILPIKVETGFLALLVIQDVSNIVLQRNVLMELGYKLEEETFRDALTGVYNRRFLWMYLKNKISEAAITDQMIGCLMMDLDHFKEVNDTHGHQTGDSVLIEFSKIVNDLVRRSDLFVRYGGEEFLLVMPNCNMESLKEKAEAIRSSVESNTKKSSLKIPITCSIGIAKIIGGKGAVDAKELVSMADRALYKAKENGRNRCEVFSNEK